MCWNARRSGSGRRLLLGDRRALDGLGRRRLHGLGGLRRRLPLSRRLRAEFFREALDAPLGIDQLLAPREERVAGRADFQVQLGLGRAGLERVATGTTGLDLFVFRVDTFLHGDLSRMMGEQTIIQTVSGTNKVHGFSGSQGSRVPENPENLLLLTAFEGDPALL